MSDKKVYAIKHPDGYFKIGVSKNPKERTEILQNGSPKQLVLWATVPCMWKANKVEGRIHAELVDYHVRGEWFDVGEEELLDVLEAEVDRDDGDADMEAYIIHRPMWKPEPAVPKGVLGAQ
jgi:NDP-sugar pyrophosphorylase family protein